MEVTIKHKMSAKLERGITMIEILIVVFIIGIMATMLGPNLTREEGEKAREEAERFANFLVAIQEESLYQINFLSLHMARDLRSYDVWKYTGQAKQKSNVSGVNERFSAMRNFDFTLESQVSDEESKEQDEAKYWELVENERFKEVVLPQDVELSIVEVKKPIRQDYESQVKFENQLILVESGIITTPFQVEFKQDATVYIVKLDEYSQVTVEKLENTFL